MDLEKGTKGRHMGIDLGVGAKAPASSCRAMAAAAWPSRTSRAAASPAIFYPKADTPGCSRETIDFTRLRSEFQKAGADVLGVSADPVAAQDKFKKKHDLTVWPKGRVAAMPRRYWPPPARCPDEPASRRTPKNVADVREADERVCPRLPSTENFRKINHNPLELARISAGVRSCDVGDR